MQGFPTGIQVQDHIITTGPAITLAAGANAGTTPPAPVVGSLANDSRASITFGSGTTPAAGAVVVVTFKVAYADTNYVVMVEPTNAATAALGQAYITGKSTTQFTINFPTALTASQTNATYALDFAVIG